MKFDIASFCFIGNEIRKHISKLSPKI